MLHNDPDPDAMASGLALRNVLRGRKRRSSAPSRGHAAGNLRMVNLLDIHVEAITPETLKR